MIFNEGGLIKRAELAKQTYENNAKNEEEKMNELANTIGAYIEKPNTEIVTDNINGVFIKYDVEYTDVYKSYEYTSINGWRLENYELESDRKTLKNVRLISTGIPTIMDYSYNDETNNYSNWIKDESKLTEFKDDVLGSDYKTYTGTETYYALQATAGYYYNLGLMQFEQGKVYNKANQGYYTKIKNGTTTYNSGTIIGDNLFKARNDAKIRILTLPEMNKACGKTDIDNIDSITDKTGLYKLDEISTGTQLTNNIYDTGCYWLASPSPKGNSRGVCYVSYDSLFKPQESQLRNSSSNTNIIKNSVNKEKG